jgi:ankyrin repeat protein
LSVFTHGIFSTTYASSRRLSSSISVSQLEKLIQTATPKIINSALSSIDFRDPQYHRLLQAAVKERKLKLVEDFLMRSINVNYRQTLKVGLANAEFYGPTAAYLATMAGNAPMLRLLIKHKADLNLPCAFLPGNIYQKNKVPLHIAVELGDTKLVKLLLKYDANPLLCDFYGETPRDYAKKYESNNIKDLLLQKENEILTTGSDASRYRTVSGPGF